ncbi:hypothetical protein [Rhodoferax sp.]|uniref:hypothetical protein n=1 Tax=Rhodoferax sp. TaxID=50421 RepID=UPI0027293A28|nr:hypothetical protein [Rhodoferax sp.]MDO8320118.1 hypothetical protein [Rhodoferax sp.]
MTPLFDEYHPERCYNEIENELNILESAWAKFALFLRTGFRYGHKKGTMRCQSLSELRSDLDIWRTRFERGETLALLHAIQLCAEENIPLPSWLAVAFSTALSGFLQPGGPHSLDMVFSSPNLPTNTPSKAATARQDWALGAELWESCWDFANTHKDVTSFDAVLDSVLILKNWGVKKRKARELVTMIDKNQAELLGQREKQPFARFLEKRRKP